MQTHYFRSRIDQMVSGMNDTAVVAAEADSMAAAAEEVLESKYDKDDYYVFTEETWDGFYEEASYDRPSTGPAHYLGTDEDLLDENGGVVMLSQLDGERVTTEDFE